MAKRSKKKNPNMLTERQKADIRHNEALDKKKKSLNIRLNIALGIVLGVSIFAFLVLPALNMNFSSYLSEIVGGDMITEENDTQMGVTVDMTFIDILTALTQSPKDSVDYISKNNDSSISSDIVYNAFMVMMTDDDVRMLDKAYVVSLALAALTLAACVILLLGVSVTRGKNRNGIALAVCIWLFSAASALQWLFFVAVGIASAGRGQIQPHIASWLIFVGGAAVAVVYTVFCAKVKKLDADRRVVAVAARVEEEKTNAVS